MKPSVFALLEAFKRELGRAYGLVPEKSHVAEHHANGELEDAIRWVHAQIKTMRIGLQSRCRRRIKADHPIMPWLIHHAALGGEAGEDGRTPYKVGKGKRFMRPIP